MNLDFIDNIFPQLNGWKTEILVVLGLLCFGVNIVFTILKMPTINELHATGVACLVASLATARQRSNREKSAVAEVNEIKSVTQDDGK